MQLSSADLDASRKEPVKLMAMMMIRNEWFCFHYYTSLFDQDSASQLEFVYCSRWFIRPASQTDRVGWIIILVIYERAWNRTCGWNLSICILFHESIKTLRIRIQTYTKKRSLIKNGACLPFVVRHSLFCSLSSKHATTAHACGLKLLIDFCLLFVETSYYQTCKNEWMQTRMLERAV